MTNDIITRYFWFRTVAGETASRSLMLARAEHEGVKRGFIVTWDIDEDSPYATHFTRAMHHNQVFWCTVHASDERRNCARSLGGIIDPARTYARVVAAELADEILYAWRESDAEGARERELYAPLTISNV